MGNFATRPQNQLGRGITPSTSPSTSPIVDTATNIPNNTFEARPIRAEVGNTTRTAPGLISGMLTNRPPIPTTTPSTAPVGSENYRTERGDPNVRTAAKLVVNEPEKPKGPSSQEIAAQQQQQAQAAAAAQQAAEQAASIAAQQAQFWANHEASQAMRRK